MSEPENYKASILSFIEGSKPVGDFAFGGEWPYCPIHIEVAEVGRIAFPLCTEQATKLISKARVGPFGKGSQTIVDTTVRKVWEIQKVKVTLGEDFVNGPLKAIVSSACTQLGLSEDVNNIQANLYKMLIYEEGGFFKTHQDTEKEPGMFGTLLVQLPSLHTGGDLVVNHMGKVKRFAHSIKSADRIYYSAFYTDCEHELEPVTSGYRMVLAFNLVRLVEAGNTSKLPSVMNFVSEISGMESAIKKWVADVNGPKKLAYRLDHQYTLASISFASLKGRDKEIYHRLRVLKDKFDDPLLSLKMVVMEKKVVGDAGEEWSHKPLGMEYVVETKLRAKKWINEDDVDNDGFGDVDITNELLVKEGEDPTKVAFNRKHDESKFEGYTGNDGAPLTYWYRSVMIVLRPYCLDWDLNQVLTELEEAVKSKNDKSFEAHWEKLEHYVEATPSLLDEDTTPRALALCDTLPNVQLILRQCPAIKSDDTVTALMKTIDDYGWENVGNSVIQLCARVLNEYVLKLIQLFYASGCAERRSATLTFIDTHVSEHAFQAASASVLHQILRFCLNCAESPSLDKFKTLPVYKLAHVLWLEIDAAGSLCDRVKSLLDTIKTSDVSKASVSEVGAHFVPMSLLLEKLQKSELVNAAIADVKRKFKATTVLSAVSMESVLLKIRAGSTVLVPLALHFFETILIDYRGEYSSKHVAIQNPLNQCIKLVSAVCDEKAKETFSDELVQLLLTHIQKILTYNSSIIDSFLDNSFAVTRLRAGNQKVINLLLAVYTRRIFLHSLFHKLLLIENVEVRNANLETAVAALKSESKTFAAYDLKTLLNDAQILESIRAGSPLLQLLTLNKSDDVID